MFVFFFCTRICAAKLCLVIHLLIYVINDGYEDQDVVLSGIDKVPTWLEKKTSVSGNMTISGITLKDISLQEKKNILNYPFDLFYSQLTRIWLTVVYPIIQLHAQGTLNKRIEDPWVVVVG